jgi:hypothetical protein
VRLAEGWGVDVSPDGKRALVMGRQDPPKLTLTPLGAGEPIPVPMDTFVHNGPAWFSGAQRIVITATESGKRERTYVIELPNGRPRPITPEGTIAFKETERDGSVIGRAPDGSLAWYPLAPGPPRAISARMPQGFKVIRASPDGRFLLMYEEGPVPIQVERLNLVTGERSVWKKLKPDDPAGIAYMNSVLVAPDEQAYAYQYGRFLQDLYLVSQLRP